MILKTVHLESVQGYSGCYPVGIGSPFTSSVTHNAVELYGQSAVVRRKRS